MDSYYRDRNSPRFLAMIQPPAPPAPSEIFKSFPQREVGVAVVAEWVREARQIPPLSHAAVGRRRQLSQRAASIAQTALFRWYLRDYHRAEDLMPLLGSYSSLAGFPMLNLTYRSIIQDSTLNTKSANRNLFLVSCFDPASNIPLKWSYFR